MLNLLLITASARRERSLSRDLAARFMSGVEKTGLRVQIVERDLAATPPPLLSESHIVTFFTPDAQRSDDQRALLGPSDMFIDELAGADLIVIATPMYNYGMPASLKAWVDQVVRIGRTFSFDLARGDYPLEPMLAGKTLVVLTASGEFGFAAGGQNAEKDHLVPHLHTLAPYLGAKTVYHVGVEYQEFGDRRFEASLAAAQYEATALGQRLARAPCVRSR